MKRPATALRKQCKPPGGNIDPMEGEEPEFGVAALPAQAVALLEAALVDGVAPHLLMAPSTHHLPIFRVAMTMTSSPDNCARPPCESPTRLSGKSCGLNIGSTKALQSLTHDAFPALRLPASAAAGGMS